MIALAVRISRIAVSLYSDSATSVISLRVKLDFGRHAFEVEARSDLPFGLIDRVGELLMVER